MRAEILETENRKTTEKTQITGIRNRRDVITTNSVEIKETITKYCGKFCPHKCDGVHGIV